MEVIFESNTDVPTEFELPSGEIVINYGFVQIVKDEYSDEDNT